MGERVEPEPHRTDRSMRLREFLRGACSWRRSDGHPGSSPGQASGGTCAEHIRPPAHAATRRKTSDALVPPKPNEFDSTTSISRLWARCGTRSSGVSTDGLSRLMV